MSIPWFTIGRAPKVKYNLSYHAKKRLKQRFGLEEIGKIYSDQIEILDKQANNIKGFFIKHKNIVAYRDNKSKNIVTVLTPEMWNQLEYRRCWRKSLKTRS